MWYRMLLPAALLLAGCQGVTGPRERPPVPRQAVDDPYLTIDQKKQRERELLAIPETSRVAPPTYMESPWTRSAR
jgi:hypothetical protein